MLDTNWYVSASINRKSRRVLYEILVDRRLEILYTEQLQIEFLQVISRPKIKNIISPAQAQRFLTWVMPHLKYVEIKTEASLSRDPKDNYLLSLSQDGKAKYLVTGDLDLLSVGQFGETDIVTMAEFQRMLSKKKTLKG